MIDIDELRARNIHAGLDGADYVGYFEVGTLRALLDELEALRAANQWLPIDGAPRDGTQIIIAYSIKDVDGKSEIIEMAVAHWQNWTLKGRVVAGVWIGEDETVYPSATHYRLLPPPARSSRKPYPHAGLPLPVRMGQPSGVACKSKPPRLFKDDENAKRTQNR